MKNKLIYLISSLTLLAASAHAVEFCGKPAQGEILVGRQDGLSRVVFNGKDLRLSPRGEFLLAFGRDDTSPQSLIMVTAQDQIVRLPLDVAPTAWDIQRLKGVPPRKVTPPDSDLREIERERSLIRAGIAGDTAEAYWRQGFIEPVKGRISGSFGGQRIMNGIPKNPHAGMDIAVPVGTEVKASSAGVVTLAAADLFYSGNVVVLDHGYGLHTIYAHLSEIKVKRGDIVKQGDIIALSGKTGRVTGPHLHWGASYNGIKFNPQSLLNMNKTDDFCFNL